MILCTERLNTMDNEELEKLAKLARLRIEDSERAALVHSLNEILGFVEHLNKVQLEDVVPLSHPLDMYQRLRTDEVGERDESEHLQAIAPESHDGYYLVPKVID